MKTKILFIFFIILAIVENINAQAPSWEWSKALMPAEVNVTSAIVDSFGNVYTTGYFLGTSDFDPGPGVFNLTSAGSDDIFISKLDANGNFLWAVRMGGSNTEVAHSIVIDKTGNVYTTGIFHGTADFDPGIGTFNLTPTNNDKNFISKLDPFGNFIWAVNTGGTFAYSIAVDNLENVYTTGYFLGTSDFDPGSGVFNLTSISNTNVFVSKLDSSSNFKWAVLMGGEQAYSIAVDNLANVYTTGYFNGTPDFDPSPGVYSLASAGGGDIFITKLDSSGNFNWARRFGGNSFEQGRALAVDSLGNVYTTGFIQDTADFDPGVGVYNLIPLGGSEVFILKLNTSGNFLWAKNFSGEGGTYHAIALDNSGNVYSSGGFRGTVDFDPAPGVFNLTSNGSMDAFISKFDNLGNFEWAQRAGGPRDEVARAITVNNQGNVYVGGVYNSDSSEFGNSILINSDTSGFTRNAFIAKLGNIITGIASTQNKNVISIYPNPAKNNFIFQVNSIMTSTYLQILNIFGEIVLEERIIDSQPRVIQLNNISAGIYLVIVNDGENHYSQKLIIQ